MKLRNKKTGKIGNFCYGYTNELCVSWQKDDGFWGKQEYKSLAELNEEWEDYEEPKEYFMTEFGDISPLILPNGEPMFSERHINKLKAIGNYFETKEEALKAVEKLKAWKRLKDKGFRFEGWGTGGEYGSTITFSDDIEYNDETIADLDLLFGGEE
jgi:hypothetical protein